MSDKPERFREVEPLAEFDSVDALAFRIEFPVHGIWIYGLGKPYSVLQARALRDWLNRALPPEPKPKRAYYETHEPPHCPTCDCGKLVKEDET